MTVPERVNLGVSIKKKKKKKKQQQKKTNIVSSKQC